MTKPIIVVRIHCKLLSFKQLRGILVNNFLASVDIKAFGRICTHLQCCFFLALHFFTPRVFFSSHSNNILRMMCAQLT